LIKGQVKSIQELKQRVAANLVTIEELKKQDKVAQLQQQNQMLVEKIKVLKEQFKKEESFNQFLTNNAASVSP
jgi:CRISPR/Cas system CMR-associated protein Cmr1 (group 7 of RAMP superfamily)